MTRMAIAVIFDEPDAGFNIVEVAGKIRETMVAGTVDGDKGIATVFGDTASVSLMLEAVSAAE